jgi:hypothetical protein
MTNINGYLNMTFVSRFQPPKAMFSARCYETLTPCMTWQAAERILSFQARVKNS